MVKNDELILFDEGIRDINDIRGLKNLKYLKRLDITANQVSEIKGLETLSNLEELYLQYNQISEIKGLEMLKNLKILNLDYNLINEIKGLKTLTNLEKLYLKDNPIPEEILEQLGGLYNNGQVKKPQKFVEYCSLEKTEQERLEKETIEKIKEMMEVSTRINLDRMQNVLDMDKKTFDNKIFKWARDFNFIIDGDNLVINKDTVSDFIDALDKQFASWEKRKEKIV